MENLTLDSSDIDGRCAFRRYPCIVVVFLIVAFFSTIPDCKAQMTDVTDVTSTPILGTGHDYIGVLSESVNPANGAVSLRIQAPVPSGRGITMPFSFTYDSNGVHFIASGIGGYGAWNDQNTYLSSGGWSYSVPQLTYTSGSLTVNGEYPCPYRTAYVFQDNQGTRYAFPMANNLPGGSHCSQSTTIYRTTGEYAANLIAQEYFAIDDPDGTVYTFANAGGAGCAQVGSTYTALPSSIEDRNGNLITVSGPPTNCNGSFQVTDTAGRTVLSSSGFGSTGNTVTVAGLSSPYQLGWGTASSSFSVNAVPTVSESGTCGGVNAQSGTETVMTSLTLPNGQTYQFYYDSVYGLLNKIVYPNGGYVSYSWGVNSLAQDVQFPGSTAVGQTGAEPAGTCEYHIDSFAVQHRYVSYDGVHVALQQDFQYATNWISGSSFPSEWSTKMTTVTNRDLIAGTVNTTVYTYSGYMQATAPYISSSAAPEIPLEQSIAYIAGSGSTLETVTKAWQDPYAMTGVTTTLPNGVSSSIAYTYGTRDQVVEEDDTDYGQSSITRKTLYNYQTFAPVPQFPNLIDAPTFSSIVDRPCQILRKDGGGNLYAEQDLFYDGGATVCGSAGTPSVTAVSSLPAGTHDETNYGPSSTTARGNLTSYTQRCLQSCPNSTITYSYDETGQATSKTDPCGNSTCSDMAGSGHTTTYSYTDNPSGGNAAGNSNAYLTKVIDPLGHTNSYSYNYPIGALSGSVDPNGNSTAYQYGTQPSQCSQQDLLNRLTEVDYPDGGITQYCYNDSVPNVETARLVSGPTWETSVSTMDGMGHVVEAQVTSDPYGTDTVLTTYNGAGRVYTKTNPYRSTSDPTYGVSTYQYDALSRPVSVQNPDGSSEYWCYDDIASAGQKNCGSHVAKSSGEWMDFADENGNDWQRTTDSFGRLTSVIEPSGGASGTGGVPAMETDYSYDILNDLVSVNQEGNGGTDTPRARGFNYDSLSRLISATNPESGTIGYSYDANSNLQNKMDARGITTSYAYDAVNRLTSKSYSSNDSSKTPVSCFQYDTSSVSGAGGNLIGRLTNAWTTVAASSCVAPPSGSYYALRSILSYDAMGRVSNEQQCTPSKCSSGSGPAVSYGYDVAGDLTALTNSVGAVNGSGQAQSLSLTTGFDGAGHMNSMTSNWGAYPTNIYTLNSYGPVGPLNWNLGSISPSPTLTVTQGYTNRLRVNSISATGQVP